MTTVPYFLQVKNKLNFRKSTIIWRFTSIHRCLLPAGITCAGESIVLTRCETSRLGAIPCLVFCLPRRKLHGNVKTFDVIVKKMGEESTRAVELALEGHS